MKKQENTNIIALNRKAKHNYHLYFHIEVGICLTGWEVKSIRAGKVQISDSYVIVKKEEIYLIGTIITPLSTVSSHFIPEPSRTRKLLLKKKEIIKLIGQIKQKGLSIIPTSMYWKKNHIKLEIALAKGKKVYDKRASIKEKEWDRRKAKLFKK